MSLKLKALGLAVFAALAVGAVSVVSASADEGGVFHSDVDWTHIEVKQEGSLHENVFEDEELEDAITCSTVDYTANVAGKTPKEITAKPTYGGCSTTENGYPVTVDTTGCFFALTVSDLSSTIHHTAHLECETTENPTVHHEITITVNPPIVGECWIHIHPQTPTFGGVTYKNIKHPNPETGKHAVTVDITAEGITYNRTVVGFAGCGAAGSGEGNNAHLTGKVIATGFNTAKEQVNITATTASS